MTIDEAISHALEVARQNEDSAILYKNCKEIKRDTYEVLTAEAAEQKCLSCAADHRQLAEWLTELKEAKRLLKAAMEDISATVAEVYHGGLVCECCKWESQTGECCCPNDGGCDAAYRWRYADEAEKLIES